MYQFRGLSLLCQRHSGGCLVVKPRILGQKAAPGQNRVGSMFLKVSMITTLNTPFITVITCSVLYPRPSKVGKEIVD